MDLTEAYRRLRLAEINATPMGRQELERRHGRVWDLRELAAEFVITAFMAPFVVVRRKVDGVVGSLEFQHLPRYYFGWQEDA